MKKYMFTESRHFEIIKLSRVYILASSILSIAYHLNIDIPAYTIANHALNISHTNFAMTAGLHTGFVAMFLSIVFANYGWNENSKNIMSFAKTTLSVALGSLLGWVLVASYNTEKPEYILVGLISYCFILCKFWLVPNLFLNFHNYFRKYHSTLNIPTLMLFLAFIALSVVDVMKSQFS